MSGIGSWRLYPKRSIASHRFCGSGRLFRGFNDGKREAGSDIDLGADRTDGCEDMGNPEQPQECKRPVMLSRNFFQLDRSAWNFITATYDYRPRAVGGPAGGCG